jgi:hypothetical protein
MVPYRIVFRPVLEARFEDALLRCPHLPVMETYAICECARLPSLHPTSDDGNVVDTTALYWYVPADVFETLAPKYLAGPRNVLDAYIPVVIDRSIFFFKRSSHKSEAGVFG